MKDEQNKVTSNGTSNTTLELPFTHEAVQLIPIASIRVLNPRMRDQKKFQQIVQSISRVGLKKPITVSRRAGSEGSSSTATYDLVCGQGRLEAFIALGETEIPALVGSFTMEERLLMSLAENITRRQPLRFEHIQQLLTLKERGYSTRQISEKVDVSESYLSAIFLLWESGEERLLRAVELGTMPIKTATLLRAEGLTSLPKYLADETGIRVL